LQSPCSLFPRRPATPTLPPFPTRRSSDLALAGEGLQRERFLHLAGRDDAQLEQEVTKEGTGGTHQRRGLCPPRRSAEGHSFPCRDRKSTRLNSSHVKISYAVFCLKKKKKV